jgi:pilus assembly protein CpaB
MNFRALLVSLAVGAMTVILLFLYLRRLEVETSGGSPVGLIAAIKPIEPGSILTADMLTIKVMPQAYVESRAVGKPDMSRIVGLRVDTALKAQQTLMWTDLAITSDDRRQLSLLVQPGMRAVGIRASHDDRHFALIRPGDRVDVYANVPTPGSASDKDRTSVVVVQNVIVLAVGLDTGAREITNNRAASSREDQVLTLSVNPQQLQLLGLAGERGKLTVGVRNPGDTRLIEGVAELPSSILTGPQEKRPAVFAAKAEKGPVHLLPGSGPSVAAKGERE